MELSAHMWPGMVLKSGNKIIEPSLHQTQELSEEESDYELEYEILSAGSAEPWDDTDENWVSANNMTALANTQGPVNQSADNEISEVERKSRSIGELQPSTSASALQEEIDNNKEISKADVSNKASEPDESTAYEFEDLEQLMSGIGTMRDNLRLMPDFQRREMAANLAMKMAAMFGDGSGDED